MWQDCRPIIWLSALCIRAQLNAHYHKDGRQQARIKDLARKNSLRSHFHFHFHLLPTKLLRQVLSWISGCMNLTQPICTELGHAQGLLLDQP